MTPVTAIRLVFQALYVLLVVRIVLSWIPGIDLSHPAVQFIHRVTAPILDPLRRLIPPVGGLDFSPLVAILLLSLVQRVLTDLVVQIMYY